MSGLMVKTLGIYLATLVVSLLVAVVIKGIVVILRRLEQDGPVRAPVHALPAKAPVTLDGIPAEHVAAIGAAVAAMIGDHHIVHIEETHQGSGWRAEGRQAHHASHTIEHPRRKSGSPEIRGTRR